MHLHKGAIPIDAIHTAMEPVDRVTLYRTLKSLSSKGIIHKAYQEQNETHYAICGNTCDSDHHHHQHIHFKCTTCKNVSCEKPANTLGISIPDYDVHHVSVQVEGICKECKYASSSIM